MARNLQQTSWQASNEAARALKTARRKIHTNTKDPFLKRQLSRIALAGLLSLGIHHSQAEEMSDAEQKKRLAEQKLKLVEMLIDSPATKASVAGRNPEAPQLINQSRELTTLARNAISTQHYDTAAKNLDEALRIVFKANSRQTIDASLSENAQKQEFNNLAEQVTGYRASLLDMSREGKSAESARKLLARIDRLSDEARQLHNGGKIGEGVKKMAEAYRIAVSEISLLRAGQEVVMSLKFDSPADEFAYEQKRYQSNQILVSMMINEGRADGERRKLVDIFLAQAGSLQDEARAASGGGEHKQAIRIMENANAQLNRALQTMGVPVF